MSLHCNTQSQDSPTITQLLLQPNLCRYGNEDDRRLLTGVVMLGLYPWGLTQWVVNFMGNMSEYGFGRRAALLLNLPKEQREEVQREVDAATAAAKAVYDAAVAAEEAAREGVVDSSGFASVAAILPAVQGWSLDNHGRVIVWTRVGLGCLGLVVQESRLGK